MKKFLFFIRVALIVLLPCCSLFTHDAHAEEIGTSINDLKGAFILNFIKFARFEAEPKLFTLCISKSPQLIDFFKKNAPESIQDKKLIVKGSDSDADINTCNVVYVPNGKQVGIKKGVLLITDQDGGGVIELILREDKLVFGINTAKAQSAQLSFPSQVMSLAIQLNTLSNNDFFFKKFVNYKQGHDSNATDHTDRITLSDSNVHWVSRLG